MSKGIEKLKEIQNELYGHYDFKDVSEYSKEQFSIIEKELKALEIIKEKRLDVDCLIKWLRKDDYELYHHTYLHHREDLTQEEYDLLKEVLL